MIGAVDIGGTKIGAAAVTECGRVMAEAQAPTRSASEPNSPIRLITELLSSCQAEAGESLRGIGVGCTGPVEPISGTVGEVELLPGWAGLQLARVLSVRFGVPVAVENDADAAALAESHWGAGKNASRFLYVTISTGIGAGVVLDGRLYRGVGGSHPELGHQTIDPSGRRCYCGAIGCWESLASGTAMVEWTKANAGEHDRLPADLSAREVCDLARRGHALAARAVERQGEYLGIGLANLVTIFCPDVIALGGGVMESGELFLARAREVVRASCGLVPFDKTKIVQAVLGKKAGLLGAARVWQARFQDLEKELIAT